MNELIEGGVTVKEERKGISLADFIISLLSILFKKEKDKGITAEEANRISRFGTPDSFDDILKKRIDEIEQQIKSKLQFSSQERLLALIVPEDQEDLFEEIKKYYDGKGFKTFYVGKEKVPEFGKSKYLFISWDI